MATICPGGHKLEWCPAEAQIPCPRPSVFAAATFFQIWKCDWILCMGMLFIIFPIACNLDKLVSFRAFFRHLPTIITTVSLRMGKRKCKLPLRPTRGLQRIASELSTIKSVADVKKVEGVGVISKHPNESPRTWILTDRSSNLAKGALICRVGRNTAHAVTFD